MKVALISDVHANLPAFKAVMRSIDNVQPDAVYCLGDLVGYNVWPNEVIEEIRRRGIATIAGNHDAKVRNLTDAELADPGKNYAYGIINDGSKNYLKTLPAHIRIVFQLRDTPLTLLLVHGSPKSNDEYLFEDRPELEFLEIFEDAKADVLCFGHSHIPYHRIFTSNSQHHLSCKHVINIGSVGKPKDGDPRACYVLLTIADVDPITQADALSVEFVRVPYETGEVVKAILDSPLPNNLAEMIRKGY